MSGPGEIQVSFCGTLGRFTLDAAFAVPSRGVTALFGPSGCGKTSVLRCIAGLLNLPGGFCAVDGDVWQDGASFRPVYRRPIGYVFQEASLFPHLSVRRNLLYGAPRSPAAGNGGFQEIVALLGLSRLLDRSPGHLSGGERQRVALGRALLSRPRLLLMDEPLAALDRQAKDEILPFIERLVAALALPVLYVSHDIAEVERLADHIVLLDGGRVRAAGPLRAIQSDPALPLAGGRDAAVSLDARIESWDPRYGLLTLAVRGGRFLVPAPEGPVGERRRLRVLAGDVSLAREPSHATTILNTLPSRILSATLSGTHEAVLVLGLGEDGAGDRLLARISWRSLEQLALTEGMLVHAQVKGVALAGFREPTEPSAASA